MAGEIANKKIYEPETIEEMALPEGVIWEEVIDAPQSLAELDPNAQQDIEDAFAILAEGLGDLAFLDVVDTLQIVTGAITNAKIAVNAIQGSVIAAGAITNTKIGAGAVQAANIAANTITAAQIAAGTITATEIAAATITAGKMNVSTLSSITANIGTINAGTINGITITGGTLRTSSSSTRVELNGSANALEVYDSGDLRAVLDGYTLAFLGPGSVGGGALYSAGSNQLDIDIGGGGDYEFNEDEFKALYTGQNLGTSGIPWNILYLATLNTVTINATGTSSLTGKLKIPVGTNLY